MVDTRFYIKKDNITLAQVAQVTSAELQNHDYADEMIANIATMSSAGTNDICFLYDRKSKEKAADIKAKACITTPALQEFVPTGVCILLCENPKEAFIKLNEFTSNIRTLQIVILRPFSV